MFITKISLFFWGDLKTPKGHFEINWPLGTGTMTLNFSMLQFVIFYIPILTVLQTHPFISCSFVALCYVWSLPEAKPNVDVDFVKWTRNTDTLQHKMVHISMTMVVENIYIWFKKLKWLNKVFKCKDIGLVMELFILYGRNYCQIFFGDLPTWGGNLGSKLHAGGWIFWDHDFL